jgi:hypothetical protein
MPPPSGQKSRSHGKAPVKGGAQTWDVQWATVALKMAGMSVRQYEQGFRRKRGKKNIFEGKRSKKKKFRGGNARRKFRWIIFLEGSTRHKLDSAVDGPTGYCERTILHGVTSQKTAIFHLHCSENLKYNKY